MNAAVVPLPKESVPVDVISTVLPAPEKLVTVLLNWSLAVILMLNDIPCVWVGIFPVAVDSTRKLVSAPGACDKEPKFVTSLVMPEIVPVPGLPEVLRILPLAGILAPFVARTCIPEIVREASLELLLDLE